LAGGESRFLSGKRVTEEPRKGSERGKKVTKRSTSMSTERQTGTAKLFMFIWRRDAGGSEIRGTEGELTQGRIIRAQGETVSHTANLRETDRRGVRGGKKGRRGREELCPYR